MKVKELIGELRKLDQNGQVLISSDEELNILFSEFEVGTTVEKPVRYVFYGLSGSELD